MYLSEENRHKGTYGNTWHGSEKYRKYTQARRQSQKKPKIVLASKIQSADAQATMKYILMEHSRTF